MEGFPKVTENKAQASATIEDIDNDGKLDLVASSDQDAEERSFKNRGSLYVWNLEGDYDKSNLPWPTFHHDLGRTGNFGVLKKNVFSLPQSKIVNNGNESLVGNLKLILQKKSSGTWLSQEITNANLSIPANDLIKLDSGVPYGWNLKEVVVRSPGQYRVYGVFSNSEGAINSSWEFNVI